MVAIDASTSSAKPDGNVGQEDARPPSTRKGSVDAFVTSRFDDVTEAWKLVYRSYVRTGLIDPNPFQIHTTAQAVSSNNSVVIGKLADDIVSTLTVVHDHARGFPLETVYPGQFGMLRDEGRRMVEVGLLADRREDLGRSLSALFEIMRYAFYDAMYAGCHDIICGVHPHHAGFYAKFLAFEPVGAISTHPTVKDHPVVMLRLRIHERLSMSKLPRGLRFFKANPLHPSDFSDKCKFLPTEVSSSLVGDLIRFKNGQDASNSEARWSKTG